MSLIYSIIEVEKEFLCRIFFSPIRVYFTSFFSVVADQHPSFFFDSSLMVRSQRTFISSQWPIEPTLNEVSLFSTYNRRNLFVYSICGQLPVLAVIYQQEPFVSPHVQLLCRNLNQKSCVGMANIYLVNLQSLYCVTLQLTSAAIIMLQ